MSDSLRAAEESRERNAGLDYESSLAGPQEAVESVLLASYRLRIMGPEGWPGFYAPTSFLTAALEEAEENISDLLPEGYYAKVEEWDT
jgi:hypothetical protein